jgi:protein involved in polysaccharide export with SLBB domain
MFLPAALASCGGISGKHMSVDSYRTPPDPPVLAVGQPINVSATELNYTIGLRDVVSVEVADHTEFSGNFKVEEDGTFELPTVYRRIPVGGLSTRQAEARIRDVIRELVVGDAQVRVKVILSRSREYYMLGAVRHQGRYFMGLENVTVRDALVEANLWGDGAKTGEVYIITPDRENKPSYVTVNAGSILEGNLRDNVVLKPGDIIYVPTTVYFQITSVLDEIIGQTKRVQDIEASVNYTDKVGTQGFGKYTPGDRLP